MKFVRLGDYVCKFTLSEDKTKEADVVFKKSLYENVCVESFNENRIILVRATPVGYGEHFSICKIYCPNSQNEQLDLIDQIYNIVKKKRI